MSQNEQSPFSAAASAPATQAVPPRPRDPEPTLAGEPTMHGDPGALVAPPAGPVPTAGPVPVTGQPPTVGPVSNGGPAPADELPPGAAARSGGSGGGSGGDGAARSAGATVAGRYRLLARSGTDASVHAEFWRARDTVLERDVGLTLLRHTGQAGEVARADRMVERALRWGRFEHPGCARMLDVMRGDHAGDPRGLPEDVLGLAVTEWVPGRGLGEAAARGTLRSASALNMVEPLAEAAELAHGLGLVLGCAHPHRIRITPDGKARVAFALPDPELTAVDDVHGLGAVLYALLTAQWPLSGTEAELAGLAAAPRDLRGVVVPPAMVRPGTTVEVSVLAMGALGEGASHGQVHTAAGVHRVVTELLENEGEAALLPPPDDGAMLGPDEVWRPDSPRPDEPERRRKLGLALTGLAAGVLVVLGYVAIQVGSALGITSSSSTPPITVTPPAASVPTVRGDGMTPPGQPADPGTPREAVVHPASVRVFDPSGDPDNPARVGLAVDDDPASTWNTYIYRRQFPALKPGVGIMVSFASPVQLAGLRITSPSDGTEIELRSAPQPDAPLSQTVLIGTATLRGQSTDVSLSGSQPVSHVLVWITKLGGGDDQNVTQLSDLRFERVTG